MTAKQTPSGIEMSRSFLAVAISLISLLGMALGAGITWGAMSTAVSAHHADQNIHHAWGQLDAVYERTDVLKPTMDAIRGRLDSIDRRLGVIEDARRLK